MAKERNYRAPRMVVRQRFVNDGGTSAVAAAVHISGPHANFVSRETESFERGLMGDYQETSGLTARLPAVLGGSVLDTSSAEVVLKNVALRYFDSTSSGSFAAGSFVIPAGIKNTVEAVGTDFSFRTYRGTSRAAVLHERDVRAGDLVRLTANGTSFWTSVARLSPKYHPGSLSSLMAVAASTNTGTLPVDVGLASGGYTAPSSEGSPKATTYTLTVTKGGTIPASAPTTDEDLYACPVLSITTNTGIDKTPFVRVTESGKALAMGLYGIQITVPSGELIEGDRYTITAHSSYANSAPYLVLRDNIPEAWVSPASATPVQLELFIPKSEVVLPVFTVTESGVMNNWLFEGSSVRIHPGLFLYDPSWTKGGAPDALSLVAAKGGSKAYLTCRYFVSDLVGSITLVTNLSELEEMVSGPIDPSNPLKYAAYHALAGGEGSQVLLTAVSDPSSLAEWGKITDLISERDDVFHVFPLCYGDKQVIDLFYRHIKEMNQDEAAKERLLYLIDYTPEHMALAQGSEEEPYEGEFSEEPEVSGLSYIAFTKSAATSVDFLGLGVRAGDMIRTNFTNDLSGNLTWSDYTIVEVLNGSAVRIEGNPSEFTNDDSSLVFEVWRNQTPREQREVIADTAGIQDMLVRYLLVDNVDKSVDPIGPAATFVGLIGSVVPHQGVSWYPLAGWSIDGWQGRYSNADLNHMAGNGVTILTRHGDGFVAARHAVTTAKSPLLGQPETSLSLKLTEEMYVRNALLLKKEFRNALRGFAGVTNLVPGTVTAIEANLIATANYLQSANEYPTLGGRITSEIQDFQVRQHVFLKDTLVVSFKVECPFALNALDCTIFV